MAAYQGRNRNAEYLVSSRLGVEQAANHKQKLVLAPQIRGRGVSSLLEPGQAEGGPSPNRHSACRTEVLIPCLCKGDLSLTRLWRLSAAAGIAGMGCFAAPLWHLSQIIMSERQPKEPKKSLHPEKKVYRCV